MKDLTTSVLQGALEKSWTRETSYTPSEWDYENASRGQCVPTSLVVQDYLGGDLQKVTTVFNGHEEGHYRNVLADGTIFDASRSQYPDDQVLTITEVSLNGFDSIRDKRLSDPDTLHRYEILKVMVEKVLLESI